MRGDFLDADAAIRAGVVFAEKHFLAAICILHDNQTTRELERRFQGIRKAAAHIFAQANAVHHDFDGMLVILYKRNFLFQKVHLPIYANTGKAALFKV